jgi:hypothetical protein
MTNHLSNKGRIMKTEKMKFLFSHPENPGYLLPCTHPTHGECLIHVGDGAPQSIERAMARCGTVPSPHYPGFLCTFESIKIKIMRS